MLTDISSPIRWRNKAFGSALDFVWSSESSNDFAIRESTTSVKVRCSMLGRGERTVRMRLADCRCWIDLQELCGEDWRPRCRFRGRCLDRWCPAWRQWPGRHFILRLEYRRIGQENRGRAETCKPTILPPKRFGVPLDGLSHSQVYWSDSGELVCLACEDSFYILRFSRENYVAAANAGQVEDDGVEAAFEVITDINERYLSLLASRSRGLTTSY